MIRHCRAEELRLVSDSRRSRAAGASLASGAEDATPAAQSEAGTTAPVVIRTVSGTVSAVTPDAKTVEVKVG
ncbi:MAG: hypothetical protein C3F12_09980 [Candidatus Methylomirabilota bacterium]|nr:hypothetical protein [Candidatus Methylomirabilis sp.]NJD68427.1 hypothetical protein [candidate division NC10 bacterium]PWB46349.1 MAG: hypothetical protein C3F12_09980 [candidate division NC10 bacterium]